MVPARLGKLRVHEPPYILQDFRGLRHYHGLEKLDKKYFDWMSKMGLIEKGTVFPSKRTDKAEEEGLDHSWMGDESQAQSADIHSVG